jgi:hypothetical protein
MRGQFVVSALALSLLACGGSSSDDGDDSPVDARRVDAALRDAAPGDGAPIDGTAIDADTVDADPVDSGIDAGPIDATIDAMVDASIDAMVDAPIDAMIDAPPAMLTLRINEVNANATNCDLVELRAIGGGDLTGLRLLERKDIVFTFPAMTVPADAIIVVHFGSAAGGPCTTGISANETTSPTQFPRASFAVNYDGAYDLYSLDAGLTATNNVISVARTTTVLDAVLLASGPTGTAAGDSEEQAAILVTQNQWQMVGGGVPAGGFVDDNFSAHAALDLDAGGTTPAGVSIQRLDNTDDNDKADWNTGGTTVQPSTWGTLNVGQSSL